jgi:hypothetical protein
MIYPFFIAILPGLTPGKAPELTLEQFDELAVEQMGEKKAAQLADGMPFHAELRRFENYLAYKTAMVRASRLNLNCRFEEPEEFYGEIDYALSALSNAAPAEREVMLDALIWCKLDDLEIDHELDQCALAIYRMKLAMLQKYASRDAEAGLRNFENALEVLSADYLK